MNHFEIARIKYKPEKIKYLFIAETPPKSMSNRFFYFENVDKQDSLFIETMKLLYPEETKNIETKIIRNNKKWFLQKFKDEGYYLIDSLENPFELKFSSSQKVNLIKNGQVALLQNIKTLVDDQTKVILISSPVYFANDYFLRNQGINIINVEPIDFPGSGGQRKYKEKMRKIIK